MEIMYNSEPMSSQLHGRDAVRSKTELLVPGTNE